MIADVLARFRTVLHDRRLELGCPIAERCRGMQETVAQLVAIAEEQEKARHEEHRALMRELEAQHRKHQEAFRVRRKLAPARRRLSPPKDVPVASRPVLCSGAAYSDVDPVIYGLVDPREPERVRYVGQTVTPFTRFAQHVDQALARPMTKRDEWIVALVTGDRMAPDMVLLERVREGRDLNGREQWWMRSLLAIGQADLNTMVPRVCRPYSPESEEEDG